MSYKRQSLLNHYPNILKCIFILHFTFLFSACSPMTEVTPESQHETKVWILEHNPEIEHPLVDRLFNLLVARIAIGYQNLGLKMPPDIRLYLINNDREGVFSLCDGSIFVSSGTFKNLKSAHQLISLLAHDIGHVYLQHACSITEDQSKLSSYELEADKLAINSLRATHVDPKELEQVYLNIYRRSEALESENYAAIDEKRLNSIKSNLEDIKEIETQIPEERLFRKVKTLLR